MCRVDKPQAIARSPCVSFELTAEQHKYLNFYLQDIFIGNIRRMQFKDEVVLVTGSTRGIG